MQNPSVNLKLSKLKQVLSGELHFDETYKALYATDASVYRILPLAIAYPKGTADLKLLISFANENGTSLIVRAAGTSLAGQCVGEGIVVDISKYFTQIVSIDTDNKTVTVQPGVIRDELNQYLEPYKLYFGPNTSTSNRSMIGGMVGNNSSGTTSIQYGVTRDKVTKLKTLLSDGSEVTFSEISSEEFMAKTQADSLEGKIYRTFYDSLKTEAAQKEVKNQFPKSEIHRRNTGYALDCLLSNKLFGGEESTINLAEILCGSEGTLAITTEITLQLDDLPPKETVMVVGHYNSVNDSLNDVELALTHNLFTCELIDDTILNCTKKNRKYDSYRFFVKGEPRALMMYELRDNDPKVLETRLIGLHGALLKTKNSYDLVLLRGPEIELALELRKAGLGLLGNMIGDRKAVACIEDTAVAISDLPAYINEFTALMKKYDQDAVYYAHAGAGELHLRPVLNLKKKEDVTLFRNITADVAGLVKKYRGSFSGEHGDGIVRGEFLKVMIGEKNYRILKLIKSTFDPNNIFNPNKLIDARKMDKSLRYELDRAEPKVETLMDFTDTEGILRLAENCNGSGDCRKTEKSYGTMCPSYHVTKDEKDTTRGRANVLREVLTHGVGDNKFNSHELKEVFDLCISCKACASECPSNVDMSTAKAEFLYQYHKSNKRKRSDSLFGKSNRYNKLFSSYSRLWNVLSSTSWTSNLIKKINGIAPSRSLPLMSSINLDKELQFKQKQNVTKNTKLFLLIDEFSEYLDKSVVVDAVVLLSRLGYEVEVVRELDSARALISKGFLEEAKVEVDKNLAYFKDKLSDNQKLVGIEPSAVLGFRDEYLRLATNKPLAQSIAEHTFLLEEFLASEIEKGIITNRSFTSDQQKIKIHNHCHQKALSNQKVTFDLLNLPVNYNPTIISSGCCGMAGSFGYEKDHYKLSMQIGALKLFPSINNTSTDELIAANGTSCRHQIKDGTGRLALHPITIMRNALV